MSGYLRLGCNKHLYGPHNSVMKNIVIGTQGTSYYEESLLSLSSLLLLLLLPLLLLILTYILKTL